MRRYTSVRNPIESLRERWGLGDGFTEQSQSVPTGQGPSVGTHPLPSVPRGEPAPYFRPLPGLGQRPFFDPHEPTDSGAVDYAARQRSQLDDVPKGEQASPITVYPAWESRMERMRDFLGVLDFAIPYDPLIPTPGSLDLRPYTVPQGYVGFWKEFRFFFEPIPAVLTVANTLITLLVDETIVPDYFNLPLGPFMPEFQKCFPLPIGEGRRLSLRVSFSASVGDIDVSVFRPMALVYGQVRPRTGEPESRDVGVRPPPPVVIQQPVLPAPAPAPPPQPQPPQFRRGRGGINTVRIDATVGPPGGFVGGKKNK